MRIIFHQIFVFLAIIGAVTASDDDSLNVTLAGEVKNPSRFSVDATASFSQVLERSGGSTLWGNPRRFILIKVSDEIIDGLPKLTTTAKEIYLKREENPSLKELGVSSGDIIYLCRKRPMSKLAK
jgi:protein involved in polysaccharide export with SLBB domain